MNRQEIPVIFDEEIASLMKSNRQPFVLRGSNIGHCREKWTFDYLSTVLGSEEVKLHVSQFKTLNFLQKNFIYRTMLFKKFLQQASEEKHAEDSYFLSNTESYYLRSVGGDARKDVANLKEQFPAISEDIVFPKLVPRENVFSSILRIASQGISIWTHYDVMDNALIQVKGQKRAVLFPPTDALFLYLKGDKSEVVNVDNPDLDKYPKFKLATKYECSLLPGDVLFIPAFWFHTMAYLDFGIAVNVFWKELDPSLYDKKDPYGNRDLLPAQQAFASLDKALSNLSKLPPYYKNFYCLRLMANIQKAMDSLTMEERVKSLKSER